MFKKIFNNITSFIGEMLNKFSRTTAVTVMSDITHAVLFTIFKVSFNIVIIPLEVLKNTIGELDILLERVYYIVVKKPHGYDELKDISENVVISIIFGSVAMFIASIYILLINPYVTLIVGVPLYVIGLITLGFVSSALHWEGSDAAKRVDSAKYADAILNPTRLENGRRRLIEFEPYYNDIWRNFMGFAKDDKKQFKYDVMSIIGQYPTASDQMKVDLLFKMQSTLGYNELSSNFARDLFHLRGSPMDDQSLMHKIVYGTLRDGIEGSSYVRDEFIRRTNKLTGSEISTSQLNIKGLYNEN